MNISLGVSHPPWPPEGSLENREGPGGAWGASDGRRMNPLEGIRAQTSGDIETFRWSVGRRRFHRELYLLTSPQKGDRMRLGDRTGMPRDSPLGVCLGVFDTRPTTPVCMELSCLACWIMMRFWWSTQTVNGSPLPWNQWYYSSKAHLMGNSSLSPTPYRCCVVLHFLEKKMQGCSFRSGPHWEKTAPMSTSEASVSTMNGLKGSGCKKMGAELSTWQRSLKAWMA